MAPLRPARLSRALRAAVPFLLALSLAAALPQRPHAVLSAPLEMRQPKPLQPRTGRGFPHTLRVREPALVPTLTSPAHTLSHPRTELRWAARFHNVQLYGGMVAVGEYYAKVKIGGQTLRVQIDTGSATLAAPLKECTNCKRGDMRYSFKDSNSGVASYIGCEDDLCAEKTCSPFGCGKCSGKQACCAKSDSTKCAFHLNFGDGSGAKGILVRDTFEWGDVKFPVVFGGIRSDSPDFERSQVDGILGMAYPSLACNPSCITPTFESMLAAVKMKNMFTICITYDSGKIVLGDYDPMLSTKQISWVPLEISDPPSFYSFPLIGNLMVNDVDLPLPSYTKAIVDSGTTLIVFSHHTFDRFKKYLQRNFCEVPGLCGPQSWFRPAHCTKISDEDRIKLPTLTFKVQDFNITLGPSEYLINYASKGPEYWCVGIMALNSMSGGVDVIFGNTVMKKYVTVYDREASRVGFAESDTKCGFDIHDEQSAQLPVTEPEGGNEGLGDDIEEGEEEGSGDTDSGQAGEEQPAPLQQKPGSPRKGETKGGAAAAAAACGTASNCSSCAGVETASCAWDASEGRCVAGDSWALMCTFDNLAGKFVYVVGGAVAAVVAVVAIAAVAVNTYRKRNAVANGEDDAELQQPLAQSVADTNDAFEVGDDDEP